MISISEETNLKTVDLQDEYMNQSLEAKPKNFFKIAFGSRINSDISSNNLTKYHSRPLRSYNSQLKEKSDLNSDNLFDLKNTSIFPLSMSNKNNDNDLNFPNKTILYKKINETLPKNEHIDNRSIIGTTKSIEDNHDEFSLSKIPHPPPRSSRPISSSVRKIRLPTTIKSQKSNENFSCFNSLQLKKEESCPEIKNLTSFIEPNSRLSNNIVNESINDLINVLKSSSKKKISKISQNNFLSSENFSEITNLDDSGNTIMYSFSSKPKPVSIVNNQIPYLTEKINKKVFDSKVTKSSNIYKCDHQKYSHNIAYTNICRSNEYLDKVNLIDSFEAQMLEEIKAESEISNQYKNSDNTEVEFESKENFNYKKIKSPDIEYFEAFQRGLSNLTNLSEEIQTSGKYNFDALTSSFEETSASYSKKNNNYKTKFDEANNYQEEMNISLLSNLPAKSINLKDNPSKHSPVPNTNQNEPTKIKQEMISEELHFDDSQADIDEISSDVNEEIDLLYDPTLNCYYDPKTCTYYELNLS